MSDDLIFWLSLYAAAVGTISLVWNLWLLWRDGP